MSLEDGVPGVAVGQPEKETTPLISPLYDEARPSALTAPRLTWDARLVLSVVVLPFLFTFKPSEWFLVDFLYLRLHLSLDQINRLVFPLWTYSFLLFTLIFALGSLLRLPGKWCLVVGMAGGVMGAACLSLFSLWPSSNGLALALASEVFVGLYSSGEVMYSALLYKLVSSLQHFQTLASVSRSMRLLGQGLSGLVGQVMLQVGVSERALFYVSLAALGAALVLSILLPFDWRIRGLTVSSNVTPDQGTYPWRDTLALCRQREVQQLSIFLMLSNAVHFLVIAFTQSLFEDMDADIVHRYDAYLLGGANVIAFATTLIPIGLLQKRRLERAQAILLSVPFICSALLGLMANVDGMLGPSLWPSFALYVVYQCVFEISRVVASALLASFIRLNEMQHYAVFFCFALVAALGLQTVVQLALQQSSLSIRWYFIVFAASYLLLPAALILIQVIHAKIATSTKQLMQL